MTGGTSSRREPCFETLKEDESGKSDASVQFGAMKSVRNKIGEFRLRMSCGWGVLGACK
jgi:hypothetical protein